MKKLVKELKLKYNINVEIHNKTNTIFKVNELIKKTKKYNVIILITRNDANAYIFNDDKDIFIIKDGQLITTNKRDIHVDHIFDIDIDKFCKICLETFKIHGIRNCARCHKTFCIKCQIKMMTRAVVESFQNHSFNDDKNILTCPYCKYEHIGYMPDVETFLKCMFKRIENELVNGILTKDDADEIVKFVKDFVESI